MKKAKRNPNQKKILQNNQILRKKFKKLELIATPLAFITALILSGMDFIDLKKYSLSKWFQFLQMAVWERAFPMIILKKIF